MISEKQFEQMMNRLDTLIKITAISAFQGKSMIDVISILSELGFGNKDIAMILGTSPAYVANVRSALKKKRAKKEKVKEKDDTEEAERE
jgi:predicted glycosyltransferase